MSLSVFNAGFLQAVRRADELHVPGGDKDGVFLAQQAGGRVLHPSPQTLLPRLLSVWTASQGPTQPHPRSLHCRPHTSHPPDDGPGGVAEQTQRGDRVTCTTVSVHWVAPFSPSVTKGATVFPEC